MSITDAIGPAIIGGGGSVAAADITDAGAAGVALVQAATLEDVAGVVLAWAEISAADAGWTRTPDAGTGAVTSVVSSRLHTELAGVIDDHSGSFGGPRHEIALPVIEQTQWSVAARVSFSGLDANGRVNVSVRSGASQIVGVAVRHDGSLELFADSASPAVTAAGSFASGDWVRLERRGDRLVVYSGTGSATLSGVTWTLRGATSIPAGDLHGTLTVSLGAYTPGPAGTLSSDVGPVHYRSVP